MFFAVPQISPPIDPSAGHILSPGRLEPNSLKMLTSTFRHFKGIGAKTERDLWRSGVCTWDAFEAKRAVQLSMFDVAGTDDEITQVSMSKRALDREDAEYFAHHLPRPEHYRI